MKNLQRKSAIMRMIAIVLLSVTVLQSCNRTPGNPNTVVQSGSKGKKTESFIHPSIPGADITYTSYKVETEKETVLTYSTGSKIHIPANTFVDKDGKPIKGQVNINYREMHDAWEIMVSGIPMTVKMDSITYHFESAGMFDIRASFNEQPVFIAKDKSISVDMVSNNSSSRFNNYYLDTISKKWIELGKSIAIIPKKIKKSPCDTSLSCLKEAIHIMPLKPRNADSVVKILQVRIKNRQMFPEFDAFQNLKFEVVEDQGQYQAGSEMNCSNPEIMPSEKPGYYRLKMKVLKKDVSYGINWLVRPAFEGYDYKKAMAIYREELDKYKKEQKRLEEQRIAMEKAEKLDKTLAQVYRSITINRLGTYNCDYPLRQSWPEISPKFVSPEGENLEIQEIMVIDKNINGIFRYDLNVSKKIKIDRRSKQILVAISNDTLMYANQPVSKGEMEFTWKNAPIAMQRYKNAKDLEKLVRKFTE